ncbi:MAG: beta-propeller fold lactonase family protein, partial [Planctomycetota bacterium]
RIKPLSNDYVAKAKVYVLSSRADDTYVFNVPEHEVIGRITVGQYPHGIEADATQSRLFISAEGDDFINVIDPATDKVLKRIPVGPQPNEIAVTPDGRLLYVPSATTGIYEVVDVVQGKIVAKIKTGGHPHNVVCSPDGKYMYLSPLGDPNRISIVQTATHQIVREIPLGGQSRPIAIRGDGKRLYIEYDPLIGFVLAQIPEGKILHTVHIELPPELQDVPSRCHGIGVTPDGKEVWVCDVVHELVAVFDVTVDPPKQIARIPTKSQPYWMTISGDGKHSYISNTKANEVQVVDVATHKTVKWIPVGDSPKRILAVTVPQF